MQKLSYFSRLARILLVASIVFIMFAVYFSFPTVDEDPRQQAFIVRRKHALAVPLVATSATLVLLAVVLELVSIVRKTDMQDSEG